MQPYFGGVMGYDCGIMQPYFGGVMRCDWYNEPYFGGVMRCDWYNAALLWWCYEV